MRQIEVAELLVTANNFSVPYTKALLVSTPAEMLIDPDKGKPQEGLNPEQVAKMQKEMEILHGSDEEKFDHPTQKPVELMRRPILNHTKPGELVYEPFLGSGTTLAAAEVTQRVCYGLNSIPSMPTSWSSAGKG